MPRFTSLQRIVVAIDPAMSSHEGSDETGIIVAGRGRDGCGYVLDDLSGVYSPQQWGQRAIGAYHAYACDRLIAETNNGGEMVEHVLRSIDPTVSYRQVHASRGKIVRAEPIAALYEQRKVFHVGCFPVLEDQMCNFVQDHIDRGLCDRVDALVWALTDLMLGAQLPTVDLTRALDLGKHPSFLDASQVQARRQRFPEAPPAGASVEELVAQRWGVVYDPDAY